MFFVDISNPWTLLIALFLVICLIYLGKEAKNAYIPMLSLVVFVILLVLHTIQFLTMGDAMTEVLARCLLIDLVMIVLSYISYMWIDDIDAKENKKKSVANTLKWFWKKV